MNTRKMIISLVVGIVASAMLSCGDDSTSPPATTGNGISSDFIKNTVINSQLSFIRSTQSKSGAIKMTPIAGSKIMPYFSHFAASALLKYPTAQNIEVVKKYMLWYMSKLNGDTNPIKNIPEIPGSVYDYMDGGIETTSGGYDSVDSYAAMFLVLAKQLAEISPENKEWVAQHKEKLSLIASAMVACIDTPDVKLSGPGGFDDDDYLSVAIPYLFEVKYLMDNCEVNKGLQSAIWLKQQGMLDGADFSMLLEKNTQSIESQMWIGPTYNAYDYNDKLDHTDMSRFYPDATAQLFPGMFGIIAPAEERANKIYTLFNTHYPNWSKGQMYDAYPWSLMFLASASINDVSRVEAYIQHLYSLNSKGEQKTNWYCMEAAVVLLAMDEFKNTTLPVYSPMN